MLNKALLKSKMALYSDTSKSLSEKMGLTESAISNRINGKTHFSAKEMNFLKNLYNISNDEFVEIFFN